MTPLDVLVVAVWGVGILVLASAMFLLALAIGVWRMERQDTARGLAAARLRAEQDRPIAMVAPFTPEELAGLRLLAAIDAQAALDELATRQDGKS
jgi:cytochrome oxidase assembly protein ShyY1